MGLSVETVVGGSVPGPAQVHRRFHNGAQMTVGCPDAEHGNHRDLLLSRELDRSQECGGWLAEEVDEDARLAGVLVHHETQHVTAAKDVQALDAHTGPPPLDGSQAETVRNTGHDFPQVGAGERPDHGANPVSSQGHGHPQEDHVSQVPRDVNGRLPTQRFEVFLALQRQETQSLLVAHPGHLQELEERHGQLGERLPSDAANLLVPKVIAISDLQALERPPPEGWNGQERESPDPPGRLAAQRDRDEPDKQDEQLEWQGHGLARITSGNKIVCCPEGPWRCRLNPAETTTASEVNEMQLILKNGWQRTCGVVLALSLLVGHGVCLAEDGGLMQQAGSIVEIGLFFLLGILLLFVELLIIPGTGVVGLLGLGVVAWGLYVCFTTLGLQMGMTLAAAGLGVSSVAGYGICMAFLATPLGKTFVHDKAISAQITPEADLLDNDEWSGRRGLASSDLRPAGSAVFDGRSMDVVSIDGFLESGTEVEVVRIEDSRVQVKRVAES